MMDLSMLEWDSVSENVDNITLTETTFVKAMHDPIVNDLFNDLDVNTFNRASLFDMFDLDGNGMISMSELVDTLMKLRGEPQKCDMIASYMMLRSMRQNLEEFQMVLLENQKRLMGNQKELWFAITGDNNQPNRSPKRNGTGLQIIPKPHDPPHVEQMTL